MGLPCSLRAEESTCQCRRCGFNPQSRRIPHAKEQLSPEATITETLLWSPGAASAETACCSPCCRHARETMLCNNRSTHSEKPTHCNREWPLLASTRESPCAAVKTQYNQKLKKIFKHLLMSPHVGKKQNIMYQKKDCLI